MALKTPKVIIGPDRNFEVEAPWEVAELPSSSIREASFGASTMEGAERIR